MESANKIGINRVTSTEIVKDAKDIVTVKQLQNLVPKKSRRFRIAFTTEQVNYLEKEFKKFPYVETFNRKKIADRLNITDRAVKIWFQNRRMKEKKDNGTNHQCDTINKMTQINENNDINNHVSNESLTKEKILLPSQHEVQHIEGDKIKKNETNNVDMDRITNIAPKMSNNTINISTSSTPQENVCCSYDDVKITSKYFKNTYEDNLNFQHIRRRWPHEISRKKRLTKKSMSSNQQHVSVNSSSERQYSPVYNYCTSLPIGGPATTGVAISTDSSVSQGDVTWKPVNMPPPPTVASLRMNRSCGIPLVSQNTTSKCNCNCHELPRSHTTITGFNLDPRIQPQYLLAIPLNNACYQI